MTAKLYSGGGEGIVHSSVAPCHGSGPAGEPRNQLTTRFASSTTIPTVVMYEPIVSARLSGPQPSPPGYVYWRRGIPSSPTMCIGKKRRFVPMKMIQKLIWPGSSK